ncbi:MAG: proton-conducting transporter membrane subunit [Enterobacterales bacterium]|nr:proton-conducting transporter membrane subunit [Enterobacterales bacterium]
MFHLVTHAFFKALLFLGAGSVIIAMHHEQDMRKMGNLKKYMPITYVTMLIGSLALIGMPFLSGFYSKEAIIEVEHFSKLSASSYAYVCVLIGVFFTALYSFRLFFMVFHTKERMDEHTRSNLKESPWVVTLPLIALAIPSVVVGYWLAPTILSGEYFADAIRVLPIHDTVAPLVEHYEHPFTLALDAVQTLPFWLAMAGVATAYVFVVWKPELSDKTKKLLGPINHVLENKYYFDHIYINYFSAGGVALGKQFWEIDRCKTDRYLDG